MVKEAKGFVDWFENKFKSKIGTIIISFFVGLTLGGLGIYIIWLWATTQVNDKEECRIENAELRIQVKELTGQLFTIKDKTEAECLEKLRSDYLFIQSFIENTNKENSKDNMIINENKKVLNESKKVLSELKQIQKSVQ